jgi:glycosyltransferase involved in cell wall biosynthesis
MPGIHIAINGWFWDQPYTGSGQYVRHLIPALRQLDKNIKLTLIVPDRGENIPPDVDVVKVRVGGGNLGKVNFEQRTFPAAVKRIGADIAHVPYWGAPLSSSAKLIITIHDVIPLSMPEYSEGVAAKLYFSLVTASAQGAAHIITDSDFSKREIIERIGVPERLVTSIPLAAAPEFHPRLGAERDPEIREKYNLPESYALYLGGFDVRKNLFMLLSAWTYAGPSVGEEFPLVLAGKSPEAWGSPRFPDVPSEIKRLKLDTTIRMIGAVDEADKPGIYRMARTFIFPSRYEGFGLPVLEAMACGTPVVSVRASSIPEITGEDAAYLVDPDDSRSMGGAIIATLIQNDFHRQLQNEGLARATNFTWQRTARETLAVYESVYARKA